MPIKIKEERGIHFLLSLALPLEIPEVPQSYLLRVIMLIGVILLHDYKMEIKQYYGIGQPFNISEKFRVNLSAYVISYRSHSTHRIECDIFKCLKFQ